MTYLVTLFDCNFQVFKNSPKLTIFGIFNELLCTQNENVARFARNVEWGFFCDYQTPCVSNLLALFSLFALSVTAAIPTSFQWKTTAIQISIAIWVTFASATSTHSFSTEILQSHENQENANKFQCSSHCFVVLFLPWIDMKCSYLLRFYTLFQRYNTWKREIPTEIHSR